MSRTLFDDAKMKLGEAIDLSVASLAAYAERYKHWAIAFSGGKDSTATVTLVAHLIETGKIPAPKTLTVLYADTRMELPPLHACAMDVLKELRERGIETRIVLPKLDERYFVYMLGRGVPPPKNRFRWCTSQIKIEPMLAALRDLRDSAGEKLLMLTGVRLGESAARDARIALSCSRDGAECGQGWFQESTPEAVADTLAPLIHFRVCHVWAWLTAHAPDIGFPTLGVARVYGANENGDDTNARTGCVGCPLAAQDHALRSVVARPEWAYLAPLTGLHPLYRDLSFNHSNRIRKIDPEKRKDGSLVKNPQRIGPLTMDARRRGLEAVLAIQGEVNAAALRLARPSIDLINAEEEARIVELIALDTWPNGWTGDEPEAGVPIDRLFRDGSVQPLLADLGAGLDEP